MSRNGIISDEKEPVLYTANNEGMMVKKDDSERIAQEYFKKLDEEQKKDKKPQLTDEEIEQIKKEAEEKRLKQKRKDLYLTSYFICELIGIFIIRDNLSKILVLSIANIFFAFVLMYIFAILLSIYKN